MIRLSGFASHLLTLAKSKLILLPYQIWDLRTGSTLQTLQYDHPVTDVQFDSRKVVAATGDGVKVNFPSSLLLSHELLIRIQIYNRTSKQQSTLTMNGHPTPVTRLRYMDKYLVSGAEDGVVKVWSL